ncbi:MAG: redox-sensing transcriptional repressor Rex [Oscillospiraceae bacterium]|nr:redox-sensing transcriptional repressor Rex [Oscillospiraceae bacterium]
MSNPKVSLPVIRRLPRYFRYICELKAAGKTRVSSSQLAAIMGSTPSQVRQDFNCFGGFGQQGIGYSVELLHDEIEGLLFPNDHINAVLVGAGSLGATIANFVLTDTEGVNLTAIFDNNTNLVGKNLHNIRIHHADTIVDYCHENKVDLIIVCIPKSAAEKFAPVLSKTDVKGVWNFSHYDFGIFDKSLVVENVHLRDSLMALSYRIGHIEEETE